ncbi:hypothetical protein ACHHYP_06415 [Achlya hypogyna]|uniref:START domain-containing protein n=1 Tax=Achlya hypogyna TaxID=1202772 RepID=A0A1V9YUG8_ACHHY|nr:hypothetical protein ACHHYP_06415 [Achlya hypogyna]
MASTLDAIFADYLEADDTFLEEISLEPNRPLLLPPAPPAKKRRLKTEIEYLRATHDELLERLAELAPRAMATSSSIWAQRATEQAHAAHRAMQENGQLKQALEEQLKLIEVLQRAFRKIPRLGAFPLTSEAWRNGKLGVDGRAQDAEALLDMQYSKLESQWIRHDLHNNVNRRNAWVQGKDSSLLLHFINSELWDIDYLELASHYWDYITVKVQADFATPVHMEVLEHWAPNLLYSRYLAQDEAKTFPVYEGRTVTKRYMEDNRVVYVWRSIVEDDGRPFDPNHARDSQSGWAVIQRVGLNQAQFSIYFHLTPPLVPPPELGWPPYPVGSFTEAIIQAFLANSSAFDSSLRKVVAAAAAQRASDMATAELNLQP